MSTILEQRDRERKVFRDEGDWEKTPFIVSLPSPDLAPEKGGEFETYTQMLEYICKPNQHELAGQDNYSGQETLREIIQEINEHTFLRLNPRDTSLGGNEALNCYPQFNEDDDIRYLATAANVRYVNDKPVIITGLGRVYAEVYDSTQKIMYITAGVAKYCSIFRFYNNVIHKDTAQLLHGTEQSGLTASKVGAAVGTMVTLPFKLMYLPVRYFKAFAQRLQHDTVTKYYDFWSDMVLFYKYVNDILIHLTVNLGIYPGADTRDTAHGVTGHGVQDIKQQAEKSQQEAFSSNDPQRSVPDFLKDGIDIFRIISRREFFEGGQADRYAAGKAADRHPNDNTQEHFKKALDGDPESIREDGLFSPLGAFLSETAQSTWNAMTLGDKFICLRVEKSVDSSESFSNSTGESSIASALNSAVGSAREAAFGVRGDIGGQGDKEGLLQMITGAVGSVASAGKDLIGGAVGEIGDSIAGGATGFISNLVTGNAYIDIPEVWTGSDYSKSYSFNTQLRDPHGGNPISFLINIGVPLACFMALGLPRSAGDNSYGSPFLIRAYCRGMFSIPMGMMTNLSITRGAPENGWSVYGLPTVVNVSWDIKDLATVMHMSLNDSFVPTIFGANSPYQEYLLTLSAVGPKDRLLMTSRLRRAYNQTVLNLKRQTWLNPYLFGSRIGHTSGAQIFGSFSKFQGVER